MCKDEKPLVSIVIPVYNGSNYLKEAIDSALAQTYSNIEVIVVNDGSNDNGATESIAFSYGDKISYYYKQNGGVSSALNLGIQKMKGEYFSWLSHDDKYLPEKVEAEIDAIKQLRNAPAIIICETKQIDYESKDITYSHKKKYEWKKHKSGEVISWKLALKDVIENGSYSGCALLIPKCVFDVVGSFDENLRYCQDFLMWMKIFANEFDLIRVEGVFVCSRVHDKQLTQTGKSLFHSDCFEMSKTIVPLLCQQSDINNNFLLSYAKYNAIYNNPDSVEYTLSVARQKGLLIIKDYIIIRILQLYGAIRPTIRKWYYKYFRHIKTD